MKLDGVPIRLQREPHIDGAHGSIFITYPCQKARHGQEQLMSMSFETRDPSSNIVVMQIGTSAANPATVSTGNIQIH